MPRLDGVPVDVDNRSKPPQLADERVTLTGFLEYQRETLAMKCAGLTAAQLRERAVPPSALSLLGLVRHTRDTQPNNDTQKALTTLVPHCRCGHQPPQSRRSSRTIKPRTLLAPLCPH